MKITKNNAVKASEEISVVATPVVECKYCAATELIGKAIEELALSAEDDPIALDAIANLSVVLLDLKG